MRDCPLCSSKHSVTDRILSSYDIKRCLHCDFSYADISLEAVEDFNKNHDDNAARGYQAHKSALDTIWFERIADRFTRLLGVKKVLDVGCGDCHLLSVFKEKGWDCYGLDFSPWAEKAAQVHGINFASGSIDDDCFGSRNFDLIVSTSTLEHVYDPYGFTKSLLGRVKDNGFLYMSGMPNYNSIAIKLNLSSFCSNTPPQHVNYFNKKSMKFLFDLPLMGEWKDLYIGTYGVPEIHKFYRMINIGVTQRQSKTNQKVVSDELSAVGSDFKKPRNKEQRMISKVAVSAYYLAGRPLSWGDKLEVVVKK